MATNTRSASLTRGSVAGGVAGTSSGEMSTIAHDDSARTAAALLPINCEIQEVLLDEEGIAMPQTASADDTTTAHPLILSMVDHRGNEGLVRNSTTNGLAEEPQRVAIDEDIMEDETPDSRTTTTTTLLLDDHSSLEIEPQEVLMDEGFHGRAPQQQMMSWFPASGDEQQDLRQLLTRKRKRACLVGFILLVLIVVGDVISGSWSHEDKTTGDMLDDSSPKQRCFKSGFELRYTIVSLLTMDDTGYFPEESLVSQDYGWPIGKWCVSSVSNFSEVFKNPQELTYLDREGFNGDISTWDMSNANDTSGMFWGMKGFNSSLAEWNVSKLRVAHAMFYRAWTFNQNLSLWNTARLEDASGMFRSTRSFNQPLNKWNTSSITTLRWTFMQASKFNQDLSSWDVSSCQDISHMFNGAEAFNQPLGAWDVSRTKQMTGVFQDAKSFSQDLGGWNVSQVNDTSSLFYSASSFRQNLCSWGERLPRNAVVTDMFRGTNCPLQNDPDLAATPPGPFCFPCEQ